MTKKDYDKLTTALSRAYKVQTSEEGKRAIFLATSLIAESFGNIDLLGITAQMIVSSDV